MLLNCWVKFIFNVLIFNSTWASSICIAQREINIFVLENPALCPHHSKYPSKHSKQLAFIRFYDRSSRAQVIFHFFLSVFSGFLWKELSSRRQQAASIRSWSHCWNECSHAGFYMEWISPTQLVGWFVCIFRATLWIEVAVCGGSFTNGLITLQRDD